MKRHISTLFAIGLLLSIALVGCGSGEDGPSFSDEDLLNRGKAGRSQANEGSKSAPQQPAATTGQ